MRILTLLLVALTSSVCTAQPQRPNIVFILADDLGIGDTKCYGGDQCRIETPHIDALAAGGLQFTDAHVNASVCGPTRAAIMTGRYPWRLGKALPGGPWGFVGPRFDTDTFTIGKMLQGAGYRTGYIGKWHLGTQMTTIDDKVQHQTNVDFTQPLKIGPPQYGFDDSFILPGSLDMYPYAYARDNIWQGEVTAQKGWSAFNRIGPAEKDFQDHEVLETFYTETESFVADQSEQPFFLFLALTGPHTPTSPGKAFQGRSKLGVYGDFVMEVDHSVERVVAALKAKGLYENTLILFSSDHGAAPYAGNILQATPGQIRLLEQQGHYASGPHRGYKFSVFEGGLRVPLIAHWPAGILAGQKCGQLVGLCDLMATFAELSAAKLEEHHAPDSISFAELLRDPASAGHRTNLIMQSVGPMVVRDGPWKLCLCPGSGSSDAYGNAPTSAVAWRDAMQQFQKTPEWPDLVKPPFVQLFDLSHDLHEDHNLAAQHPERVADMVALLRKQIHNGRSTPGPPLKNDVASVNVNQRLPEFVRKQLKK
jgi:arylsulfatase A